MRHAFPLATINAAVLACGVLVAASIGPGTPEALAPTDPAKAHPAVSAEPADAVASAIPSAAPAADPSPAPPHAVRTPVPARRAAPVTRTVSRTGWGPYARVGPVTLHFPGSVVEVVGLHQSGHDGAQPQQPVEGGTRIGLMDSRKRDTNAAGAADIVVDPSHELRSPVTGTVLRAGTYTLYCDYVDQYLVVEPAARPGWEVKLLHFQGLAVGKGDRVQAGVTVVGSGARTLPFTSQVDEHTVAPHWPHVHVEVVDPSVPDRPSGGGCD
ncbi:MAG: hypothetical protein WD794_03260 [Mycobacteriales bacterium]